MGDPLNTTDFPDIPIDEIPAVEVNDEQKIPTGAGAITISSLVLYVKKTIYTELETAGLKIEGEKVLMRNPQTQEFFPVGVLKTARGNPQVLVIPESE